ncbi:MAG: MarR family transcriptional regulator [Chthonomonas sp.]|nr:MarR family transcriptional regulator [Chthonomonas sp.]
MDAQCAIGLATYEVLLSLEQAPGAKMTMGELAGIVILSPSGVTRLVDRLEKQGLVARETNAADKRSFYTVLTPAGRAAREKAWPVFRDGIREHFVAGLSDDEADALTNLLLKFVKKGVGTTVHL